MFWEEPFMLNILLLCSFQTSHIRKPGTNAQDLLIISLSEKIFLHFFRVLLMLLKSLSVCLNIEAAPFDKVEVKRQRLSR